MIINSLKNLRVRYDESDKTSYSEKVSIRNSKALNFSSRRTCTQKKHSQRIFILLNRFLDRFALIDRRPHMNYILHTHVCMWYNFHPEASADIYLNRDIYLFIFFFNKRPCRMLFILTKLGSEMFQSII